MVSADLEFWQLDEWRGLTQGVSSWLRIRAFARHPIDQFLATLSIPGKNHSLSPGTLTLGVNKYKDSVVEYRYIRFETFV